MTSKADQLYIAEQTATGDRDHDSIAPITEYLEHDSDQRCSVAARATQPALPRIRSIANEWDETIAAMPSDGDARVSVSASVCRLGAHNSQHVPADRDDHDTSDAGAVLTSSYGSRFSPGGNGFGRKGQLPGKAKHSRGRFDDLDTAQVDDIRIDFGSLMSSRCR